MGRDESGALGTNRARVGTNPPIAGTNQRREPVVVYSFRPPRTSYPWLSLRATRSKAYASGLPAGVCRRIGPACIRGRK
jgi:hypothetical protein